MHSTGQFGKSTSIVNTVGSANYSCVGHVSRAGHSSDIPFYYSSGSASKRTTIIVAVCLTIGGLLGIGGATLCGLWMRRKIMAARCIKDDQDILLEVFQRPDIIGSPDPFGPLPELSPGLVHHPWSQHAQTDSSVALTSQVCGNLTPDSPNYLP